ncbi:MAG TPA: hypothetical protein VLB85_04875 [Acidimicrobiia bacterium]|nr:hypothetical protein [Acidimicrobiia bacterium]
MDARARPLIVIWLVVGSLLWWGSGSDWGLGANLAGVASLFAIMALGVAGVRAALARPMWWSDGRLHTLDAFVLGALVGSYSGVIEASWMIGLADGRNLMIGLGAIYLWVGLGLGSIARWSLGRLRDELARIASLLGRTLPTLLILVLFLMFAAELWEAAHSLSGSELVAVIVLLVIIATVLVATSFRSEMSATESAGWEELEGLALPTPAQPLSGFRPLTAPPPLSRRERLNLGALVLIGQLIQSIFVAVIVSVLLVLVGLLAFPPDLLARWMDGSVTEIVTYTVLGENRVLSSELLKVSCLLGSVVGLYFTGLSITDSAYRSAHFEGMLVEMRQLIAARAYYRAVLVDV